MKFIKILLISTILLGLIFYLSKLNLFKISEFNIEPDKISCASDTEIKKESQILDKQLFLLQQNLIKEKLKIKFICIKDIDFSYKFPGKLELKIIERKPSLIVNVSFVTDEEGFVFAERQDEINVPKLQISGFNIKKGAMFPDNIIEKSLTIFTYFSKISLNVADAKISSEREFVIISDMKIFFNLNDNIDNKLASLQLILNQAKIESRDLESIDLRFDKPIIKYGKRQNNLRD